MKLVGCYENPKTLEVRVVFKMDFNYHAVIKLFRAKDDNEFHSVKFWYGDFSQTISHWNTKMEIKNPGYVSEARNRLITLLNLVSKFQKR